MDGNQRLEAAAWAIGLSWGYSQLEEVIAWTDKIILEMDTPDGEIIELSLTKEVHEAIQILNGATTAVDRWQALSFFLKRFASIKTMEPKVASVLARHLFREVAYDDSAPPELKPFCGHWDDIDLAIDGIVGDPIKQVEEFLEDIRIAAGIPT